MTTVYQSYNYVPLSLACSDITFECCAVLFPRVSELFPYPSPRPLSAIVVWRLVGERNHKYQLLIVQFKITSDRHESYIKGRAHTYQLVIVQMVMRQM